MRLTQLRRPVVAATNGLARCAPGPVKGLQEALAQLRIGGPAAGAEGRRYASVKSQGAYRLRDSSTIPKKLGAKKTGDSYVIPGNIIYKQRGTKWFPGENVGMGRDHTLFSRATGYVKYYKDPAKHPDRQYIGVVFNKEDKLPYPRHAMRRRKLGMTASVIKPPEVLPAISASGIPTTVVRRGEGRKPDPRDERVFKLARTGYSYQEENWRLGTLIRTEKRKMGSRRVVLRHRRARILEVLAEKKLVRVDKIARRKEALDAQRAARQKKMREYHARRKAAEAQATAAAASPKGAEPGPPKTA